MSETISQRIFMLMKQRGMTQKYFSEQTEISQSTISDWKRKQTNPSAEKILKICDVLHITPYELLSENDYGESSTESDSNTNLSEEEYLLVESFRKLDARQKQRVRGYMEALSEMK